MTLQAKIVFSLVLISVSIARAGGEHNGRGVRSVALANSLVASVDDVWSLKQNPAALAPLSKVRGRVFFVPQQFGLEELKTIALAAGIPLSSGVIGVGVDQFGFSLYKELTASVGFARLLDWGIAGGIAMNVHRFSIERYGATNVVSLDVGFTADLADYARLGCSVQNIGGATMGRAKDPLPQIFHLGGSVAPVENLLLTLAVEKDIRFSPSVKAGVEHVLFDFLSLRVGVANNPQKFAAGFAVWYSAIEFGYAGYSHPFLGWTHQIEIGVRID